MSSRPMGDSWITKWSLWPVWVLATLLGALIAGLLGTEIGLFAVIRAFPFFDLRFILLDAAVSGVLIGTVQWIFLRRYLSSARVWIVATMIGLLLFDLVLAAGAAAVDIIGLYPEEELARRLLIGLVWGVAGASLASIQWGVLRTRVLVGFGTWILASGLGAAVGAMLTPIGWPFIPGRPAFDLHEYFYLYLMFALAPVIGQSLAAGFLLAARMRPDQIDRQMSAGIAS